MNNDYFDLANPRWWMGVVVMGVILNLVSSYLKPVIDTMLSRYSIRFRESKERNREKFNKQLSKLIESDVFLGLISHNVTWSLFLLGFAFVAMDSFVSFTLDSLLPVILPLEINILTTLTFAGLGAGVVVLMTFVFSLFTRIMKDLILLQEYIRQKGFND